MLLCTTVFRFWISNDVKKMRFQNNLCKRMGNRDGNINGKENIGQLKTCGS